MPAHETDEKWRIESVYFMWFGAARFGGRTDASDGFDEQHGAEGIGGLDAHTEQDVVRQMPRAN